MTIQRPLSKQPLPTAAKKVFQGILFSVYQWQQTLFDGSTATFEKITRRDTAGVLAITEDKKIILTVQEQPGIEEFIGVSGGVLDSREDPLVGAKRELLEETGYESDEWELWNAVQPTTKIDWAIFTFIARNCKKVAEPRLDAGEKVRVIEVSFEEFLEITKEEKFRDTQLALSLYRMSKGKDGLQRFRNLLLGEK